MNFRVELWQQAQADLALLSEQERARLEVRLSQLARAAERRRRSFDEGSEEFARLTVGAFSIRLRLDWRRATVEVTSIALDDDD